MGTPLVLCIHGSRGKRERNSTRWLFNVIINRTTGSYYTTTSILPRTTCNNWTTIAAYSKHSDTHTHTGCAINRNKPAAAKSQKVYRRFPDNLWILLNNFWTGGWTWSMDCVRCRTTQHVVVSSLSLLRVYSCALLTSGCAFSSRSRQRRKFTAKTGKVTRGGNMQGRSWRSAGPRPRDGILGVG